MNAKMSELTEVSTILKFCIIDCLKLCYLVHAQRVDVCCLNSSFCNFLLDYKV